MAMFTVVLGRRPGGRRWSAIAFADSTVAIFAAILVFGATVGNLLMLQPLLIAERFGVLDYARIFSRSQFITMFGTAGGPLLLGWLYDNAGGYHTSYLVAARRARSSGRSSCWRTSGPADGYRRSDGDASLTGPQRRPGRRGGSQAAAWPIAPVRFPDGAKTAADAAAAIGVDVGQIVKSLIFAVDGEVVLAYVSGANQLDEAKLAAAAGGARAAASTPTPCARRPASRSAACRRSATRTTLRVFVDPDLLAYDEVWAAAGTWHDVFAIAPADLVRASGGDRRATRREESLGAPFGTVRRAGREAALGTRAGRRR